MLKQKNTNPTVPVTPDNAGISIYSYAKTVYVNIGNTASDTDMVEIFDISGRKLFAALLKAGLNQFVPNVGTGVYVVKVTSAQKTETRKVFIN